MLSSLLISAAVSSSVILFFQNMCKIKFSKRLKVSILIKFLKILGNRNDLISIDSDFEDKLRRTNFTDKIIINNMSLNQLKNVYLNYRERGNLNFDLNGLYEKRFVNSSNHLNHIIVTSTEAYFNNSGANTEPFQTLKHEIDFEKTDEVTFTKTFGFSIGFSLEIKFGIKDIFS